MAPFSLLRVAALPYEALSAMTGNEYRRAISSAENAVAKLGSMSDDLNRELYEMVPTTEIALLRRELISLKRACHNRRRFVFSDEAKEALRKSGRDHIIGRETLRELALEEVSLCKNAGTIALTRDVELYVKPWLRAITTSGHVANALAVAAPALLLTALNSEWLQPYGHLSRWQRSLLRYAIRAATKTSPFSVFTPVSVLLDIEDDSLGGSTAPPSEPIYSTRISRGIVGLLRGRFLAIDNPDAIVALNASVRSLGAGRVEAIIAERRSFNGRPWRHERVARFRFADVIAELLLMVGCERIRDVHARLVAAGLERVSADMMLQAWMDRALLTVDAGPDAFEYDPGVSFNAEGSQHGLLIDKLLDVADSFENGRDGRTSLVSKSVRLTEELKRVLPQDINLRTILADDAAFSSTECDARDVPFDAVRQIAAYLASKVIVNPVYACLRDLYVASYGSGAITQDIMPFIFASDALIRERIRNGIRLTDAPEAVLPGCKVPVTIFLQTIGNETSVDRPRYVVNRVYEGAGWLAARFAWGAAVRQEKFRKGLRAWLKTTCDDREPVDVPYNGECSELQAHPPLTDRVLNWPTESLRDVSRRISVNDIVLSHNTATNLLEFWLTTGEPIAPLYLGSAVPQPNWGPVYSFLALTRPFIIDRPDDAGRLADGSHLRPRETAGNVVLRRASWSAKAEDVRPIFLSMPRFERALLLKRYLEERGIPQVCFIRAVSPNSFSVFNGRIDEQKPQWFDSASSVCIELLERVVEHAESLEFTEMLPGVDDLVYGTLERGGCVSEHHLEVIVSSR